MPNSLDNADKCIDSIDSDGSGEGAGEARDEGNDGIVAILGVGDVEGGGVGADGCIGESRRGSRSPAILSDGGRMWGS